MYVRGLGGITGPYCGDGSAPDSTGACGDGSIPVCSNGYPPSCVGGGGLFGPGCTCVDYEGNCKAAGGVFNSANLSCAAPAGGSLYGAQLKQIQDQETCPWYCLPFFSYPANSACSVSA